MSEENVNKTLTLQHYVNLVAEDAKKHFPNKDNTRAKLRAIKKIPLDFLNLPIIKATPPKIKEEIEPILSNMNRCDRIQVLAVIRKASSLAFSDHVIPFDYGKEVKIHESSIQKQPISDDIYAKLQEGIFLIDGGKIFGLAAHLNVKMTSLISLKFEDCYENDNTVNYTKNGAKETSQLYDPDGIKIFQEAIKGYQKRMSDPSIAKTNPSHLLFFTNWGAPYQDAQCKYILEMLREYTQCPDLNIRSVHNYLIKRSLHSI